MLQNMILVEQDNVSLTNPVSAYRVLMTMHVFIMMPCTCAVAPIDVSLTSPPLLQSWEGYRRNSLGLQKTPTMPFSYYEDQHCYPATTSYPVSLRSLEEIFGRRPGERLPGLVN